MIIAALYGLLMGFAISVAIIEESESCLVARRWIGIAAIASFVALLAVALAVILTGE